MTPDPPDTPPEATGAAKKPPPTWGDRLRETIHDAVAGALRDVQDELDQIAIDGGKAAAGHLYDGIGKLTDILEGIVLGTITVLDPPVGIALDAIKATEGEAGKLGGGFGLGYLLGTIGFQAIQPILLPLFHEVSSIAENEIFDPQTAAQLAARGIISTGFAESEGSGGGLDKGHMDQLVEGAHTWPAAGELLELLRRGDIQPADVTSALTRQGLHPEWIPRVLELSRILLSPADLALNVLRGFISMDDATAYAARLGVDAADFQTLIENTGEPPGTMQLLEAYRRGIIPKDRLEHGIVQSRVRPEWIDVIEGLRFAPMSAADAVNAAVQNHLDKPAAAAKAAEAGLNPDDFEVLYENHGRPLSRTELAELYLRGLISKDIFDQGLRESDLKDKYIDTAFLLNRRLVPIRQVGQVIMHGIQPPEWGIEMLMMQGYQHDDAAALVQIETEGKAAVHKELAQSMITEMYEARAIGHDEAVKDLGQLGWTPDQADFILAVQDAKVALSEQRKAVTAIRKAFLASRIDGPTARDQLADIGVLSNQQDTLLSDWKIELEGKVAELTAGDIADAVRYGGLGYEAGLKKLQSIGYTAEDAPIYLAAHQALPPAAPPPSGGVAP